MPICFRPLTGINFNLSLIRQTLEGADRFRPLTGINFNGLGLKQFYQSDKQFPSPHGNKFQLQMDYDGDHVNGFRPLMGINFNDVKESEQRVGLVSVPSRG